MEDSRLRRLRERGWEGSLVAGTSDEGVSVWGGGGGAVDSGAGRG